MLVSLSDLVLALYYFFFGPLSLQILSVLCLLDYELVEGFAECGLRYIMCSRWGHWSGVMGRYSTIESLG